jgi:hypothetical protein
VQLVRQPRWFEKEGTLRRVPILTGNGGLFLDFEMERGVDGAMTGYAFPEMLIDVVRLSREGRREEAHDLFDAHLPLVRYEQQQGVGLATRKYVMMKRAFAAATALAATGGLGRSSSRARGGDYRAALSFAGLANKLSQLPGERRSAIYGFLLVALALEPLFYILK